MDRRKRAFGVLLVGCIAVAGTFVARAALHRVSTSAAAAAVAVNPGAVPSSASLLVRAIDPAHPRLNGQVERLQAHGRFSGVGKLKCFRIDFRAGRGVCLTLSGSGVDYVALIVDQRLHVEHTIDLTGLPSRARMSPDGRYASFTTFTTGDSYTAPGQFSTRTLLVDVEAGNPIADLESFRVLKAGKEIHSVDFNFWGVTFAKDSDIFYATLGTGSHHYLVRGSVRARTARVVTDRVECPSLSPDNRLIGFKQPLGSGRWRFSVLDLRSGKRWQLSEQRSIDDQLAWLDDGHLVYGDGTSVWMIRADGKRAPVRIARNADSPAVIPAPPA